MSVTRTILPITAALLLAGCGILGKKSEEIPGATLPAQVGRIVMVDAVHGFALIDTGSAARLPPQASLLVLRDRQSVATLVLTAESRPPYLAAEIASGQPVVGDVVFLDEARPEDEAPRSDDDWSAPSVWEDFPESDPERIGQEAEEGI